MNPEDEVELLVPLEDLRRRIGRYINFRWIYILALAVVGVGTELFTHAVGADPAQDALIAVAGLAENGLFHLVYLSQGHRRRFYDGLGLAMILTDLALVTMLVYLRGGLEARLIILYAIPILISGGLFGRKASYLVSAGAVICYSTVLFGDYLGFFTSQNVLAPQLHHNFGYFLTSLFFYNLTFILVAGIGDFVTGIIRHDEFELRRQSQLSKLLQMVAVVANEADDVGQALQSCLDMVSIYAGFVVSHAHEVEGTRILRAGAWYITDPSLNRTLKSHEALDELSDDQKQITSAIKEGKTLWRDMPRSLGGRTAGLRQVVVHPIVIKTETVAVMEFFGRRTVHDREELENVFDFIDSELGRVHERKTDRQALQGRTGELERLNQQMIGRELKMVELKQQLERLRAGESDG